MAVGPVGGNSNLDLWKKLAEITSQPSSAPSMGAGPSGVSPSSSSNSVQDPFSADAFDPTGGADGADGAQGSGGTQDLAKQIQQLVQMLQQIMQMLNGGQDDDGSGDNGGVPDLGSGGGGGGGGPHGAGGHGGGGHGGGAKAAGGHGGGGHGGGAQAAGGSHGGGAPQGAFGGGQPQGASGGGQPQGASGGGQPQGASGGGQPQGASGGGQPQGASGGGQPQGATGGGQPTTGASGASGTPSSSGGNTMNFHNSGDKPMTINFTPNAGQAAIPSLTIPPGQSASASFPQGWAGNAHSQNGPGAGTLAEVAFNTGANKDQTFYDVSYIDGANANMKISAQGGPTTGSMNSLTANAPDSVLQKDASGNVTGIKPVTVNNVTDQNVANYLHGVVGSGDGYVVPNDDASTHAANTSTLDIDVANI